MSLIIFVASIALLIAALYIYIKYDERTILFMGEVGLLNYFTMSEREREKAEASFRKIVWIDDDDTPIPPEFWRDEDVPFK